MTRETSKCFQDLIVWKRAHQWVLNIYALTKTFPKDELFGLTSQLRRASVSITANIAEGYKRRSCNDKAKFYNIAQSSLEECRYYLILATDLKLANCEKLLTDLDEIGKLLGKYYLSVYQVSRQDKFR